MNNFILVFGFIYWLFCYGYGMAYIRESFIKQNTIVKTYIVIIMTVTCVVSTPFSIGSHLADFFSKIEEEYGNKKYN